MAFDQKSAHAREFTNHEVPTLTLWNELQDRKLNALARGLLDAGLMLEHYTSLLDHDPALRLPAEHAQQAQLAFVFGDFQNQAIQALAMPALPPVGVSSAEWHNMQAEVTRLRADMADIKRRLGI